MIVWAASVVVFSFAIFGLAAWNRRDALFASEQAAATFLEQSLVRLRRRERLPRMLLGFAVTESIFSLGFCGIWFPARLVPVAGCLLPVVLGVGAWSRWQSKRLRAERAGLEKLRGEISRRGGDSRDALRPLFGKRPITSPDKGRRCNPATSSPRAASRPSRASGTAPRRTGTRRCP